MTVLRCLLNHALVAAYPVRSTRNGHLVTAPEQDLVGPYQMSQGALHTAAVSEWRVPGGTEVCQKKSIVVLIIHL